MYFVSSWEPNSPRFLGLYCIIKDRKLPASGMTYRVSQCRISFLYNEPSSTGKFCTCVPRINIARCWEGSIVRYHRPRLTRTSARRKCEYFFWELNILDIGLNRKLFYHIFPMIDNLLSKLILVVQLLPHSNFTGQMTSKCKVHQFKRPLSTFTFSTGLRRLSLLLLREDVSRQAIATICLKSREPLWKTRNGH